MLKKQILKLVITVVIPQILKQLPEEAIKAFLDRVLDWAEAAIARSETKLDDATLLPFLRHAREVFEIPDNDPPASGLAGSPFEFDDDGPGGFGFFK